MATVITSVIVTNQTDAVEPKDFAMVKAGSCSLGDETALTWTAQHCSALREPLWHLHLPFTSSSPHSVISP